MRITPLVIASILSFLSTWTHAQSRSNVLQPAGDPRGAAELTVCTQNLENYGTVSAMRKRRAALTDSEFEAKQDALVARFVAAECDAIALQEVLGANAHAAKEALEQLALALRRKTNRVFENRVGISTEMSLQTGFLIARDRAEIVSSVSYADIDLPKLVADQRPRKFGRAPLEVQLLVKPRDDSFSKAVTLVNVHFKSKRGKEDDPAALEWETYRMEMAEAVRTIVQTRHAETVAGGDNILVVLGDRNSNFDVASAKILDGTLVLADFQINGRCRMSKRGVPLCQSETARPPFLFSALLGDPQTRLLHGTYRYKSQYSWLDDILMPAPSLRFARSSIDAEGDYESGVISMPEEASDHALAYVRLNW